MGGPDNTQTGNPKAPHLHPDCHFVASAFSAVINFPLWKASTIGQSGFVVQSNGILGKYIEALKPPYKGVGATIFGMTWARAAIFYGSDAGKNLMLAYGAPNSVATFFPPMVVSTFVQFVNMPIVRATITIQNPTSKIDGVISALKDIHARKGVQGLWHGTSAGVLKTVPKYVTAVLVKDYMEQYMAPARKDHNGDPIHAEVLLRSAKKSATAGVAGAVLTNPLDVLRNEMFKTDLPLTDTLKKLQTDYKGLSWTVRGMGKNMVAVAIPVASTIFLTDAFINLKL